MRNLKRVLALALALVMMLGMMITASAATYTDDAAIDADYAEAVEVLTGMGVFQGQSTTSKVFAPKAVLTRAEAATLIYRVITGDVKDKQVDLYDYAAFADTAEGVWYTPYITYAANGGYIKGYAGNAMPNETVTGIQVMAIMLRAAGYGQNGEYEGAAWKDNILTDAKELGITGTISTNDLDKGATRELVAQLIFNAMTKVEMVSYAPLLGYYKVKETDKTTVTLAEKVFNLDVKGDHDHWGRPTTVYYNTKLGTVKGLYAEITATPDAVYTVEVSECDIAKDLGLKKDAEVVAETLNGDATTAAGAYVEVKFAPTKTVGAQGRLTEVYDLVTGIEIVYIDQFLAEVVDVTEVEYDKNGHVSKEAKLSLTVYGENYNSDIVLTSEKDYEYAAGDMLLVYYDNEGINYLIAGTLTSDLYVEFVGYADSMVGAQTKLTTKASHVVEGTEYPDAVQFNEDQAGVEATNHTWYFDTYGNLIGAFDISTKYSYGVISAIKWVEMDNLLEDGYALATITYMDGSSENATIAEVNGTPLTMWNVEETMQENAGWVRKALYQITTGKDGLILTDTTYVANATIETGVPAMATNVHAGNSTQYLVWNGITKSYETYTGIKNIPTYEGTNNIWVKDVRGDKVVEYVFINNPVAAASKQTVTYFWNTSLEVETILKKTGGVDYYVVSGGYVNGVKGDIKIAAADVAILDMLTKADRSAADVLFTLDTVNGYVKAYDVVTTMPVEVKSLKSYAVYAGPIKGAVLAQDVLVMADGTSYDVDGAACITHNYGLAQTVRYDAEGTYLYVIYTYGKSNEKIASLVYITDVEGTTYVAPETVTYTVNGVGEYALGEKVIVETLEGEFALVESDATGAEDIYALIDAKDTIEITVTGNMVVTDGYYDVKINGDTYYTTLASDTNKDGEWNAAELAAIAGVAETGSYYEWVWGTTTKSTEKIEATNTGAYLDLVNYTWNEITFGYVTVTIGSADPYYVQINDEITYTNENASGYAEDLTITGADIASARVNCGATLTFVAEEDVVVTVVPFVRTQQS